MEKSYEVCLSNIDPRQSSCLNPPDLHDTEVLTGGTSCQDYIRETEWISKLRRLIIIKGRNCSACLETGITVTDNRNPSLSIMRTSTGIEKICLINRKYGGNGTEQLAAVRRGFVL